MFILVPKNSVIFLAWNMNSFTFFNCFWFFQVNALASNMLAGWSAS